jgi:hypothetical protein
VFVENHGILSGINIVPYSIHQELKFVESKCKWARLYTKTSSEYCTIAKNVNHFISVTKHIYHVSFLMNLLIQTHPSDLFVIIRKIRGKYNPYP